MIYWILLVLHAPALVRAWAAALESGLGIASIAEFAALHVSLAVFVLQAMGSSRLRLRFDGSWLVASVAVILLLHLPSIAPLFGAVVATSALSLAGTVALLACCKDVQVGVVRVLVGIGAPHRADRARFASSQHATSHRVSIGAFLRLISARPPPLA